MTDPLTDEQLAEMRARHSQSDCTWCADVASLLDTVAALKAERDSARKWLKAIADEFERTIKHAEWKAAGSKGMHVPFNGDFASVVQLPSVISRMRWWLREFRRVLPDQAALDALKRESEP